MLRVVLIAVLVIVLLRFLLRLTIVVLSALPAARSVKRARQAGRTPGSIALVRCSRCGAYVPRASARGSGDALLCSACAGA
jgi:hypothetical protein